MPGGIHERLRASLPTCSEHGRGGLFHVEWWSWWYLADWLFTFVLFALRYYVSTKPPFEQDFRTDDPSISHPTHVHHQTVPKELNMVLIFYIPLAIAVLFGLARKSFKEMHHGVLTLWAANNLMALIAESTKNRVGRLRPDFLARCQYSDSLSACTGPADLVTDGRKSFPSGHSASAFAGMGFLVLLIAGKTGAWAVGRRMSKGARLWAIGASLVPLFLSGWVAISRVEDRMHHPTDVLAGSTIGLLCALAVYLVYYPNPFSNANFAVMHRPRNVYGDVAGERSVDVRGDEEDEMELGGRRGGYIRVADEEA